ncbi:hypothetical protein [Kitasatospora sp. GP82]|uniref:hypothetical protein n=1 Tax=Kitasatospora sp. GP82 TaxID=3035089 RepID=UPI0024733FAD|nr:hypothetical protein [Kitasatospora sp. GP82]MDH6130238.1 hypothetical protein [Kitasatospora sp. GP82]
MTLPQPDGSTFEVPAGCGLWCRRRHCRAEMITRFAIWDQITHAAALPTAC